MLSEDRAPSGSFWDEELVSSRLLQYEVWVRMHALDRVPADAANIEALLELVGFVELDRIFLERALEPFPRAVRTLDALHLATLHYLHTRRGNIRLASYDKRMIEAARAMDLPVFDL